MCGYPGWENNEVLYEAMKSNASFLLVFDVSSFCKDGKDLVSPVILQLFNLFQQIHIRIGNCEIQLCVVLHMLPIFGLGKHRRAKLQIILQARLRDVHMGGAQMYFGVTPDLTAFGKIVAGGYPGAGALGGKKEYMKYLGAGLDEHGGKKALVGGTMTATPLSCCAGYYTLCEIERTRAWEKAAQMGNRLTDGLNALIDRRGLPFVAYNVGSICHLDTVGTMHFAIRWSKPWEIPHVLKETSRRKSEMQHIGAAYMAEGLVTLAGNRMYTSAAYTEEDIDRAVAAFERAFEHIEVVE